MTPEEMETFKPGQIIGLGGHPDWRAEVFLNDDGELCQKITKSNYPSDEIGNVRELNGLSHDQYVIISISFGEIKDEQKKTNIPPATNYMDLLK